MTMLSFRVEEDTAERTTLWAKRLGVDRSELIREAVRLHLDRLASEAEAGGWTEVVLDDGMADLAAVADWGPAEDWADWSDAAG